MIYYIKQKWFQSAQVCVLLILEWGLQAAASLLMIQTFDAIFRLNAHDFLFWTGINLVTWGLYFATSCLREIVQARTIRILNNEVRHDLYRTFWKKLSGLPQTRQRRIHILADQRCEADGKPGLEAVF